MTNTEQKIRNAYAHSSVETLWETLKTDLKIGAQAYIPSKLCKSKDGFPWITSELKKLMNKRDRLYKKRKHSPEYADLKRLVQQKQRQAYWNYVEDMVTIDPDNANGVPKKFWTYIKHRRSNHNNIPPLKCNGVLHHDSQRKADILNDQFKSVFTSEDDTPIPPPTPAHPSIHDITITEPGVLKLLTNLKVNKACGPDGISPRIMKELAAELAPTLTLIFKKSYETSTVPQDWLTANVSPIFKKGEKTLASNYRPVSLTCISSKIMEHIVTSHIMNHATQNNILYDLQHGFRSKLSCETQLVEFINDVINNMNSGTQTDVIVMDFSKAFDKVSHQRLIGKLRHYGINGKTVDWIEAFLSDRSQRVVVEGQASKTVAVTSGVPQGSVLGPSLFLFYINDIAEDLSSKVRLFADDTIIYTALKSHTDTNTLQRDLDRLSHWEAKWKMQFHPEKCQVIPLTRNKNVLHHKYTLNGHTLSSVNSTKYLGVTLSSDLRWNLHIENITSKANKTLSFVRRNLKISSPKIKAQAYFSLVRPLLEYASPVWDPYTQENINKIEMVQRRAARYATNNYDRTSSVTEMIDTLNWRTLEQRRADSRLSLFYKIVNNLVEIPSSKYLSPCTRPTRHHHNNTFQIPCSNSDYHLNSFFPRTIRTWNSLPNKVVESTSLETFKRNLHKLTGR